MAYTVLFTKESRNDIEKLDVTIRRQLQKKLLYFSELDDIRVVAKKLINYDCGEYRIRVGNYRLIFDIEDRKTLIVLRVQHRKDVYR